MSQEFLEILEKYSSYNQYQGSDKETHHSYGNLYVKILGGLKQKEKLNILEIGILTGAFLQVLSEYLPHAQINGIDININNVIFGNTTPNIKMFEIDGTDISTPYKMGMYYDLIIDDGSHIPDHQIKSLDIFAPYLNQEGIYVLEDIHPAHENFLKSELAIVANKHNLHMEWIDLRHCKNRYDDIIAVFTKKN